MKLAKMLLFLAVLTPLPVAWFMAGCETQSSDSEVWISPSSADLAKGESQTFKAFGSFEYTWTLSNPSLGILSTDHGDTTTYTSLYLHDGILGNATNNLGSSEIQTLTVKSRISASSSPSSSSSGSGSNSVSANGTATATIYPMNY